MANEFKVKNGLKFPDNTTQTTAALPLTGGTLSDKLLTTFNSATGLANGTFNVAKTVLGGIHFNNGAGATGNGYEAAITFQGGTTNEAQAGIYVHNNGATGTYLAIATTDLYATGPQIAVTISNTGVVNFPRATPTIGGTSIAKVDQTTYIGTTAIAINRASASQALTGITSIDGSAATLTTTRTLWGQNFNGGANVTGSLTSVGDITGSTTLGLYSTTTSAVTLDSGTTGAINIGTNANAKTITLGNVTGATSVVVNSGTAGVTFNQVAAGIFKVQASAAPTTDMVQIINTGQAIVTAGVNALEVTFVGGAAAVEAGAIRTGFTPGGTSGGIWNGYRIVPTAAAASGVTMNGFKFDNITAGAGTDNMIYAGTGWDNIISYNGTSVISGTGIVASASIPTLDLAAHLPDSSYKKIVRVATVADLAASTFSANVLTGYSNTQSLACTTTAGSTNVTTTSTAGLKVGAVVSTATAQIAAGTVVNSITSATVFVVANRANITTTAITGNGATATATFAAQTYAPYAVGSSITISGVTPTTYNGTFVVTACSTTSVSWASTETVTATVQGTIAFTIAAGTSITTAFAQTIAALAIDGVTLAANDRVLVKDQRTLGGLVGADYAKYNGIYYVSATGSTSVPWTLTRATDADAATDLDGAIVNVSVGTANYGKSYKTRFAGTHTLNTTRMHWNRVVDVMSSSFSPVPVTAVGTDISTDTETIMYETASIADFAVNSIGIKTVQAVGASTHTRASSLYIAGAPVASTNVTITTPYSLYIAGGISYLGAGVSLAGVSDTATAATHYFVETGSDGFVRPKTLANVQSEIVTTATVGAAALTSGTASVGVVKYNSTTATAGQFDGGTTTPTGSTRLNYGGYFYATYINLIGSADTTTAATHYFVETGSDGYVRPKTLANVKAEIVGDQYVTFGGPTAARTYTLPDANSTLVASTGSITGSAGSVANAVTFNSGGSGAASGTTFNGSAAVTVSYNTIGAAASSHTHTLTLGSTSMTTGSTYTSVAGLTLTGSQFNGTVGATTASTGAFTSISSTGQLTITKAWDAATISGQIYLNGATGNRIDFNANGVAAPAFTTRSAGTKLVLYPNVSGTTTDFALGIDNNTMWYSIPTATAAYYHKWYAATTNVMTLSGAGALSTTTFNITADTNNYFSQGILSLRGTSPTIYLRDTDGRSSFVHCNASTYYVLGSTSNDATSWATVNGGFPMSVDLTTNAATFVSVLSLGNVTAYSSDRRLKENIKEIPNALEKLKKIRGVTFDWNRLSEDLEFVPDRKYGDIGVIAQEVEEVLPQVIAPAPFDAWSPDPDTEYTEEELEALRGTSKSGENYKTVRYEKLVPLLIEAIKELSSEVDHLKQLVGDKNA